MLVLMRKGDAEARGLRVYATIAGWGYSSDGRGGMTRPEASGHRLAIDRAYRLAGFDIGTVGYLEGHGTGTAVGDATELRAFTDARSAASPDAPARPDQHREGKHRAHEGGGGRRWPDQGDHGGAPPGDPSGHWPRRAAPGAQRGPARRCGSR